MMGFTGDSYMSSLLALDELWPSIAKSMGGRIIAMAPAPDVLIVAHDDDASAIPDLKKAGREVMSKSLHPLSSSVYRWSEKGWTIAEP